MILREKQKIKPVAQNPREAGTTAASARQIAVVPAPSGLSGSAGTKREMKSNLHGAQGLMGRLSRWLDKDRLPNGDDLMLLFTARLTDMAANKLAKQWAQCYGSADTKTRSSMLTTLVQASAKLAPREDQGLRLFKRLYAQAENLELLVQMRADMLRWRNQIAKLSVLERELEGLLSSWFDVGMLELRPITWDSPASLLEKLIQYEAVHEIRSWDALRHRVDSDRRCYAFFHPRMNTVPLIFVEVAFSTEIAGDVQKLLDPQAPTENPQKARWAIFYSISNTQPGLRGISFGNFLLKRVIDALLGELPKLQSFATLSPIPGFADWLRAQEGDALKVILSDKAERLAAAGDPDAGSKWVQRLQAAALAVTDQNDHAMLQRNGKRLAFHYVKSMKNGQLLDPVARFHMGNGARIERINWAADCSDKGIAQSCGLMVNYLYELNDLDDNLAQLALGKPREGKKRRWL